MSGKSWCGREDLKRVLAVFKDLQDSGQQAAIIGHFTIQLGHIQEVANVDNVREPSKNNLSEAGEDKNPNRYITEHMRDNVDSFYTASRPIALLPDLLEAIDKWVALPNSTRTGIMITFISSRP
jgi:hypothetical protein